MRCSWPIALCLALGLCLAGSRVAVAQAPSCDAAAEAPARDYAIPARLLRSIAAVESARRPWSVNVDGAGYDFANKPAAVEFVRRQSAQGARFIDVGCFQIDLHYHPDAFADLDQAFDPAANAAYAGRFLASLHAGGDDWGDAVASYHSRDPVLGGTYRALVYAALNGTPAALGASSSVLRRFGMQVFGPDSAAASWPGANHLPRVFEP